jgi:hypothetical protein
VIADDLEDVIKRSAHFSQRRLNVLERLIDLLGLRGRVGVWDSLVPAAWFENRISLDLTCQRSEWEFTLTTNIHGVLYFHRLRVAEKPGLLSSHLLVGFVLEV